MKRASLLLLALLAPTAAPAQDWDECEHRADRAVDVPAQGADLVRVMARAGSLRIEGRPGLQEVRVRGTACSSDRGYLEQIRLETAREGSGVRVEVVMPERNGRRDGWNFQARLDLVIEVPQSVALDVVDSSGEVSVREVASLRLEDGSGGIEVARVEGAVEIDDSSGDIHLRDVRGDVRLTDSSGGIDVRDVQGTVTVEEDSSGDIEIAGVTRDVRVRRDSSGSIGVADVRGSFEVERDGSGGIRYRNVTGEVRVPPARRRGR